MEWKGIEPVAGRLTVKLTGWPLLEVAEKIEAELRHELEPLLNAADKIDTTGHISLCQCARCVLRKAVERWK